MDAYEATRVVFSRVQDMDPENATKIMGLLLIQDHGENEMIRLAFGPEGLLQNVVLKMRKDLGLHVHQPSVSSPTPSSPANPSATAPGSTPSPLFLARQNSASRLLHPSPLAVSSPTSWAPSPVFLHSNSTPNGSLNGPIDVSQCSDELISPGNPNPSPFYNGTGDLIDELQLQDQLSFLSDQSAGIPGSNYSLSSKTVVNDLLYSDNDCRSPSASVGADGMLYPYSMEWSANGQHRRSISASDACFGSDAAAVLGWKPCLYFARGYCKNGAACRFVHGLPDEATAAAVAAATVGAKIDAVIDQQRQGMLLRTKSLRAGGGGMSQLVASAFPYSPTGSLPQSTSASSKCLSILLQQQQNETQSFRRAAAAALMLGGDDTHKFMGRSRLERGDFNPGSRQIYLTFPADSTFREDDVSNYFSIYGPVQDVRIPYQQKRMFGFVTFVYPETVKLILAKGNPHFVCDARVLVKPYKEKGKVPDKKQQAERGDFSGYSTPTGIDSREPFDLQHLGAQMLYNSSSTQELLLRRRLEEQQQALKLQQAIELQGRRFMGLQLLDVKGMSLSSSVPVPIKTPTTTNMRSSTPTTIASNGTISSSSPEESPPDEKSSISAAPPPVQKESSCHGFLHQMVVNAANKEESACNDSDFQDGDEHNLPDSPFAPPIKSSTAHAFGNAGMDATNGYATNNIINSHLISSTMLPPNATLDMASLNSCFFQVPRFSGHGAIGM